MGNGHGLAEVHETPCSGTHHRESRLLVPGCAARRLFPGSTTVLGGKVPLRRACRRALASCAPLRRCSIATGGSAGNQKQPSVLV